MLIYGIVKDTNATIEPHNDHTSVCISLNDANQRTLRLNNDHPSCREDIIVDSIEIRNVSKYSVRERQFILNTSDWNVTDSLYGD